MDGGRRGEAWKREMEGRIGEGEWGERKEEYVKDRGGQRGEVMDG